MVLAEIPHKMKLNEHKTKQKTNLPHFCHMINYI